MEKLFYTIGETAEMLGESTSLVRYWSNEFPKYVNPHRNGKGNRLYTASDIEALRRIHYLVRVKGLTLEGAAAQLASEHSKVDKRVRALESLKEIRRQLTDIRAEI